MHSNRRRFLRQLSGTTAALTLTPFFASPAGEKFLRSLEDFRGVSPDDLAGEEEFWRHIKQAYTVSPTLLNLNNGGVCPQPRVVQEAVEHYNRFSNEAPSYYMWRILDRGREPLRQKLADLAGCSIDEIAINRNASEALETIIFGLRLQPGDEVVLSKYDYPNMINAWKQRAHRDGIILKWIKPVTPSENPDALAQPYIDQFTPNTRIVHLTHMINWSGQIMPVNHIAKAAHQRGIEVLVDGAHTFAHIDYKIPELDCDYFGTSLHKWLCAPFGSGMLYVRKGKIKNLYPLFAAPEVESDDIRKFEHLGTRSFAIEQAIAHAIEFHHLIGSERKAKTTPFSEKLLVGESSESTRYSGKYASASGVQRCDCVNREGRTSACRVKQLSV
jgi:selenocysteine lyase/cysteine desulfurase